MRRPTWPTLSLALLTMSSVACKRANSETSSPDESYLYSPKPASTPEPEPTDAGEPEPEPAPAPPAPDPRIWPLPRATGSYPLFVVGKGPFTGGTTPLSAVSDHLEAVLRANEYEELWWYAVPNGFVIFTHIEQITATGAPRKGADRFCGEYTRPKIGDSFKAWLDYMLHGMRGRFRVFAFVVTDGPDTDPTATTTTAQVVAWEAGSPSTRPEILNGGVYGPKHHVTVLIYQFERHNADDPLHFVTSETVRPRQHLERAGLLPALQNPARPNGTP